MSDDLVGERYTDALGVERVVPEATRTAFTALLAAGEVAALTAPTVVVREGEPVAIDLTLPQASWTEDLRWIVTREDGSAERGVLALREMPVVAWAREGTSTTDRRRAVLPLVLPLGYHRAALDVGPYGRADLYIVVAPVQAHVRHERAWGIAVQLYTLRSSRNAGIGDFTDLAAVCALAADAGARYVGLNPLHAPHRSDPEAASPYAPSSRVWLNWLAIDIEAIPEATVPSVRTFLDSRVFRATLAELRATPLVDYTGVAAAKDAVLRRTFAALEGERYAAFRRWTEAQGAPLRRFATFEVLVAQFGRDLAAWPPAYRDPQSADVATFARAEATDVAYGCYLQWIAAEQLAAVAAAARERGVLLYRDLAVGVESNGADAWAEPAAYVRSATVGAPPDVLNTKGQDWGLPPSDPRGLARDGYRAYAELVRANVRDAGALRIDHAFSLARLFWVPRGAGARDGAYIRYPLEDLVGILALESRRAECVIIGEDLGTVPAGFRERMTEAEILSYRILFFERENDGSFTPPEAYPERALAAVGTHDLAPFRAWLRGEDIPLRVRLGLVEEAPERAARAAERERLLTTLVAAGDLAEAARDDEGAIAVAAHRFLARTPCRIAMVQLDDALGETTPVNVPGTVNEYPNWRRKLRLPVESIAGDGEFRALCTVLREVRPR